jgi:phospholipid-translocating ATPase
MIFKKLSFEFAQFTEDSLCDLKHLVAQSCKDFTGPLGDREMKRDPNDLMGNNQVKKKKRREQKYVVKDMALSLTVCHNVTPVYNDEGEKDLQASSPDEVALVKFGEYLDMKLVSRD